MAQPCSLVQAGRHVVAMSTVLLVALGVALAVAVTGLVLSVTYLAARSGVSPRSGARAATRRKGGNRLEEELRQAQDQIRRTRHLTALSDTLDLDQLLARVLQAATALADADAGAVALRQEEEPPVIKSMNLPAEDALAVLSGWQQEGRARAATIRYRFGGAEAAAAPGAVHLGVLLPLVNERGAQLGALAVFWRRPVDEPSEDRLATLEELATAAGRAIENVRRFDELRELAVRDPLSGLHNRRYFHETLEHEVRRAHRYDRRMALMFFDLDDFKAINDRLGHLGGDAVLAAVAERLSSVVRASDIACRVGGDEFSVILPESSVADAEHLFMRLQLAMQGQPVSRVEKLSFSAGMAELRRDDDATSLFHRAEEALRRAKRSGKGQVVAAEDVEEL